MAFLQFGEPGLLVLARRTGGVTGCLCVDMSGLLGRAPVAGLEIQRGAGFGIGTTCQDAISVLPAMTASPDRSDAARYQTGSRPFDASPKTAML